MKVLYIDPFSSTSHANFNRLHIEAIRKNTVDLHFVFKEAYYKEVGVQASDVDYSIPLSCYVQNKGGLINRLYMCLVWWKIRQHVCLKQYDKIIVAAYEEISLFFAFYRTPLYLINHNNLSGLDNRVKRFFFKAISKRNIHIVLEPNMKEYLNMLGISNVEIVRHGLIAPYTLNIPSEECQFQKKTFLFSPSITSVDEKFINKMINDEMLISFLEKEDIYLVIRSKTLISSSRHIKILSNYLTKMEYISYFLQASAILLIYPASFKYRVSGVLLEAISCGKKVIMSDIDIFRQYENLFGPQSYFTTIEDLMACLKLLLNSKNYNSCLTDLQRTLYMPDYSKILYKDKK